MEVLRQQQLALLVMLRQSAFRLVLYLLLTLRQGIGDEAIIPRQDSDATSTTRFIIQQSFPAHFRPNAIPEQQEGRQPHPKNHAQKSFAKHGGRRHRAANPSTYMKTGSSRHKKPRRSMVSNCWSKGLHTILLVCSMVEKAMAPGDGGRARLRMDFRQEKPPRGREKTPKVVSIGLIDTPLYEPLSKQMAGSGPSFALRAGDTVPDFVLPDENAQLFSLSSLLERGSLVLSFLGGSWCSFCVARLKTLEAAMPSTCRATLAAVVPETGCHPRRIKSDNALRCRILSDVDYGVGLSFGLMYLVPEAVHSQMTACGLKLRDMHGTTKPMLPFPATYVIASSRVVTAAKIATDYTMPLDVSAIMGALANAS